MTDPLDALPGWAREMLAQARVGHLGLIDDLERPRVLPVTYALAGGCLYTAVDDKPKRAGGELARVRHLRRRPAASITVDRYDDDWSALAWVQVTGAMEIREPAEDPSGMEALRAKYAPYREQLPGGPLLRLIPGKALCWRAGRPWS